MKKAFFVSIPHAGERVPAEAPWLLDLPERLLMFDVDRYVDILYRPVLERLKIANVIAEWHRYAVDLNRLAEDVDADSVVGSSNPSGSFPRGLHWSITTSGEKLMPKPISLELHNVLVGRYFQPFHNHVRAQFEGFRAQHAKVIYHLDAHSMPSVGTKEHRDPGEHRADVVVSDCSGKSCSSTFRDLVLESYKNAGFKVVLNWPYLGGRVTETYGHPDQGQESIQVELNRALYMDETSKALKGDSLIEIQRRLGQAIQEIYQGVPSY